MQSAQPHQHCTDHELRQLLQSDDAGTGSFDQSVGAHVELCADCQSRLSQLAADDDTWREARTLLSPVDDDSSDRLRIEMDHHSRRQWFSKAVAWTEAMARQVLAPASHPEMLGRIGRYDVERLIGSGGMGVVFKAFDTELNRPVAVKILAPYLAGSGAARKRFSREARAAAAVVHEHVVAIHNVESDGEAPFLVMQYVAGESLQQRLDREGPLELREILRIALQTASGLAAAHAQGLVHRDVKPSNILLEQGVERALLTDFGLARAGDDASLTHTGYHPGTPQYMSPEQARGDSVDARSDLFSLGSVLYIMCTGRLPFRADTSYGVLRRITDNEPRPIREINPDIPPWLERLVQRLQAKSAEQRFPSAAQVATLLQQCLAHVEQPGVVALPAELIEQGAVRRPRDSRLIWLAATGVCMALVAAFLLYQPNDSAPEGSAQDRTRELSANKDAESDGQPTQTEADMAAIPWNSSAAQIDETQSRISDLELRSQYLWDPE
ncbi:MAG: serine/threonine protein kinase [Planctomycetaceae bacterium]|nr:serine/threonine protein kinase [Planctomycetaceae bacterium]